MRRLARFRWIGLVLAITAVCAAGVVVATQGRQKASSGTTTSTAPGTTETNTSPTTSTTGKHPKGGTSTTTRPGSTDTTGPGTTGPGTTGTSPPHSFVQLGVDVWWEYKAHASPKREQNEASAIVDYARSDLHANSVAISFPIYTLSLTSDNVFAGSRTPSPSEIGMLVSTAEAAGLRVELRPLLDVGTLEYIWRGNLHPSNTTAFFDSYGETLLPYAEMAQQLGVSAFVYASEFLSLSRSSTYAPDWSELISRLSSQYHGPLVYAESGSQFLKGGNAIPDFASYGVHTDAYFGEPGASPSASLAELYHGWAGHFDASTASSTVLQEVGFDAQSTGYENPQAVVGTATDPQYLYMQQTWFAMVCEIVHHFNLAGVYFWNLNFNIDPTKVSGDDLSLGPTDWMNRPGATAIASCFANFGSAG